MMKLIKRVAVAGAVLLIGAALFAGWFLYRISAETGKMPQAVTQEVADGIYAIKDGVYTNMYLVKTADGFIAVDAAQNAENIRSEMNQLKILPEKVTTVFLTHTDMDHIGALKLFSNAKVYISTAEEQMINGKTVRMAGFMKNRLPVPYETLEDQQVITVSGVSVQGISTPGHTPGSMSYLIEGKYLFTGDTLSLINGQAALFNEFFNMDSTLEGESIRKLASLTEVRYLLTGHHGYSDDFEKAMAAWK